MAHCAHNSQKLQENGFSVESLPVETKEIECDRSIFLNFFQVAIHFKRIVEDTFKRP